MTHWLRAGTVGKPHGLDGSFYVTRPSTELLAPGGEVVVDGKRRRIVRRSGTERKPIVRFEDCADRVEAERMTGLELLVGRESAPPLGPDEWWAEDLAGCEVCAGEDRVGKVKRLVALPSCEVLEVSRPEKNDLLVPLVKDAVREVDIQRRMIEVDLEFLGE